MSGIGIVSALMMLATAASNFHLKCEGESSMMNINFNQDIYDDAGPFSIEYDLRPSEGAVITSLSRTPLCSDACKPEFGPHGVKFVRTEPHASTSTWDQLVWIYDRDSQTVRSWYVHRGGKSFIENSLKCREE